MAREATNRFIQGEKGPRRKDNDLYEPTGPLKQRVRQITECSDDLSALSVCSASGLPSWKKDSCLSKLILFLILAFSVAALVLVILIIYGTSLLSTPTLCNSSQSRVESYAALWCTSLSLGY